MQDNHSDILDRLNHPEEEPERKKAFSNILFIRNMLNILFIILAIVTMVCIGLHFGEGETPMWCYLLGIVAVIVKMCESMLRMAGSQKSNAIRTHRRTRQ